MSRRDFLSAAQRLQLLALPNEPRELARHYTFSASELVWICKRRREHNRLGFAVQLACFKYPGLAWTPELELPEPMLRFIALQVDAKTPALTRYGERDETRREHLSDLQQRLGWVTFSGGTYQDLRAWLIAPARITDRGIALVDALLEELRRRKILMPRLSVLERLARETRRRARDELYRALSDDLSITQRQQLDSLLSARSDSRYTSLSWLRDTSGAATAANIAKRIERLRFLRGLGIPIDWAEKVHANRLKQLAREGVRLSVNHLRQYETRRKFATLVAIVLESMTNLTDEIFDMNERVLGGFFKKAERKHLQNFQDNGRAINEKVVLYGKVGQALIQARAGAADPFAAIEAVMSWDQFTRTVGEANALAQPEDFDYLERLVGYYSQLRRYAPGLLEIFTFQPTAASHDLVAALTALRAADVAGKRELPADVPTSFVRKRWAEHVLTDQGVDRRYYEFCVFSELSHALRSGDLWVAGSRQFKDFEHYFMPKVSFQALRKEDALPLAVETDFDTYFARRAAALHDELKNVDYLAKHGQLPEASIVDGVLKVSPIIAAESEEIDRLTEQTYGLLPRVKITDLLLEVDQWTRFTQHFTHLRHSTAVSDPRLLLTAILADAINLGPTRMAQACPGTSLARLIQTTDWHIRDETYAKALAELVNHHHQLPLALDWGKGTTASSDGQRFPTGARGEAYGQVNMRYGSTPSVMFYTHVSDQYTPFYTKVIHATVRDATHVLDGLLYHESDLKIQEHYTDTAGFTDHVFALCHLLGFRFAPRIRDLADKRLYTFHKASNYPVLAPLIGATLSRKLLQTHWPDMLWAGTSIKQGHVTASLFLRKLGAYPRQNSLALGFRELGRLERTLHTLLLLKDVAQRRRTHAGLNKGEGRNALARTVFFNRLGEIRDRSYEDQRYRASGLNLVVAAIILWNTVYLERAVEAMRANGIELPEDFNTHLSPLGWGHINLTGDYLWRPDAGIKLGRLRALRPLRNRPL